MCQAMCIEGYVPQEFWDSVGFSNLYVDTDLGKLGDIEIEDVLKFLDNVKSIIGDFHF